MAKKIFDLGARYQAAFGAISGNESHELHRAAFADSVNKAEVYILDTRSTFEQATFRSSNNKNGITFGSTGFLPTDQKRKENGAHVLKVFAPPLMCTFRKRKRIDVTILDGAGDDNNKAGETVENYGHEPWNIYMRGILIDMENHNHPGAALKSLIDMFNVDAPWSVEGETFAAHKVSTVYFSEIDSEGVAGFQDTWAFTLTAHSINPVEYSFSKQL